MDSSISVLDARLDWLTVTTRDGNGADELCRVGAEMVGIEQQMGNLPQPFIWRKYAGQHCGAVSYGNRQDGAIVELSGWAAETWFSNVYALADNVTRIDVCVTARYPELTEGVARAGYDDSLCWRPPNGIRPSAELRFSSDGGSTFYLGKRGSDVFARLYDKQRESPKEPDYQWCWRWECEYKAELASAVARGYSGASDRSSYAQQLVYGHFARRGIAVPWQPSGNIVQVQHHRAATDSSKRLAWLQASVRPVVQRLMAAGYASQAATALGFCGEVADVASWLHRPGDQHHKREIGPSDA